ncbi:MAG: hypothetical protein WBQ95_12610 [Terracidiphilus sp.]
MIRPLLASPPSSVHASLFAYLCRRRALSMAVACTLLATCLSGIAFAQAITIDTHNGANKGTGTVDRRFAQIQPTNVLLDKSQLDPKTRLELIRVMQSEQGFAMRPFPMGHRGLTLEANGRLTPAGEPYLDMVTEFGICAKPGDLVVLSDVKFDRNKIIFELNGGPDLKHRFLRHIQLGGGVGATSPVVQDDGQQATGARLTLEFKGRIPELTGTQVKALLAPLISFDVKTPIQAFTDTLPTKLKDAILNHDVMVGMTTDMVVFALGQPQRKVREVDGQMPFEEWIYGAPPKPVQFVRINGNRVIRVEIAKVGEPIEVFTKDEVEGLMRTDGSPLVAEQATRTVKMGDVERNPDTQSPAPPPTLTAPGETLPENAGQNQPGAMKPVQFPTQKPDDYPDVEAARRADQQKAAEAAAQGNDQKDTTQSGTSRPASPDSTTPPATSSAPTASPGSTPPSDTTQPH